MELTIIHFQRLSTRKRLFKILNPIGTSTQLMFKYKMFKLDCLNIVLPSKFVLLRHTDILLIFDDMEGLGRHVNNRIHGVVNNQKLFSTY